MALNDRPPVDGTREIKSRHEGHLRRLSRRPSRAPRRPGLRAASPVLDRGLAVTLVVTLLAFPVVAQQPGRDPAPGVPVQDPDAPRDRPEEEPAAEKPAADPAEIDRWIALYNRFDGDDQIIEYDPAGRIIVLFWGNASGVVTWPAPDGGSRDLLVRIYADRIAVLATATARDDAAESRAERETGDGAADGAPAEEQGAEREEESPESVQIGSPTFYAEGNVRLEGVELRGTSRRPDLVIETDAFFYDHVRSRGLAVRTRGRGRLSALERIKNAFDDADGLTRLDDIDEAGGPTMGGAPVADEPAVAEDAPAREDDPAGRIDRADPPEASLGKEARQMAFRAETLRVLDADHFEAGGLVISTCEFAEPHVGLYASGATITREEDDSFDIDLHGPGLGLGGVRLLPLPFGRWNTRWQTYNPISRLLYSNSSKFGNRAGADWNVDWGLGQLPGADSGRLGDFLDDAEIDFRTEYLEDRGFGYGPHGEYGVEPERWVPWELDGESWRYYGTSVYYRIDDRGEDRTAPPGTPPIDDDRWWANVLHRQQIPYVGVLDVEYSERSDENFLNEYFQSTRYDKEQESLAYFRRTFRDNIALTGLYKFRSDDFESTAERAPEAKAFLLEQPLGDLGVYTSLAVQAARLRNRPSENIDIPRSIDDPTDDLEARTRDYGRFDGNGEVSVPFGFGQHLRVRPFANARYSVYETGLDPSDHSIERYIFGTGVTASQQWSRVFRTDPDGWARRWFGFTALKHDIIPKATYAALFENSVDPERFFQLDEVDAVDNLETVDLSVRNILWARGRGPRLRARREPRAAAAAEGEAPDGRAPSSLTTIATTTHALVDFETSLRWFLQPARDNSGDRFSELDLDLSLYPLRYVALRGRVFLDPDDDLDVILSDTSVTVDAVPERLYFTVGERIRDNVSEFYYGRVGLRLSRRYHIDAFAGFDPDDSNRTEIEVRVRRMMHRFALELTYSFDAGERDNQTFGVNFYPVELIREGWEGSARRSFRY